jgi:CRP-like cAMP-binding protein
MEVATALNIFRQAIARFVDLNEAEWIVFTQHLKFSLLKKKHLFAEQDKPCDKFGFIVKGAVRYYHVIGGEEITRYFSFEKEFVAAPKSYFLGTPANAYIQALEDTYLITFTRADMDSMLANPMLAYKMERFGRLLGEYYLCCYEDRVTAFITQSPEERYLQLFNTGKEVLQRIPQHYIAHYLGITPVSLSRIRRRVMEMAK